MFVCFFFFLTAVCFARLPSGISGGEQWRASGKIKTFEMEVLKLDIETNDLYGYFEKSNMCTHKKLFRSMTQGIGIFFYNFI